MIKVMDYDTIGLHDELGRVKIPLFEASESILDGVSGLVRKDWALGEDDAGTINLNMRFVPFC